jgi:leucyl-tRNA synthetase
MSIYPFKEIEKKWQNLWEANDCYKPNYDDTSNKFYNLTMFSYPSGDRLHIGHWYNYGPADTYARFKKMNGYNVFQPQGFDAFGLPAENYAIKHNIHPSISTETNINTMRQQLRKIGAMYDWDNEINTSSPNYYKWTQWLFLKLYENKLAYQKKAPVNWCPSCKTVLANEQVKEAHCERCGEEVTKRNLTQWFFKITKYAEELLQGLDDLDWPKKTKHMQKNWIGKSVGATVEFKLENTTDIIEVFTTRPDTLFGATYIVLAPEHDLLDSITIESNVEKVTQYRDLATAKTEIERLAVDKTKSGVFTGAYAINPINNAKLPIWVADYVVASYGSGAIMAVPSGDSRDFEFATKYKLPIIEVISPDGNLHGNDHCFSDNGIVVNSDIYSGKSTEEAKILINKKLEEMGIGGAKTQYKLHDWLISRQRYWGAPIPIIYCDDCGTVPVSESELPVLLPEDIQFSDSYGDDISPLATHEKFINTNCPKCGKKAHRDPDTMDTFVCSSWYYLRFPNANISDSPFDVSRIGWLPVDQYIGGAEHATMHLLYSRFVTKALRDMDILNFDEPFLNLFHQGTITKDGTKMSKSKGNSVSPDEFIEKYGSDTFRAYLMFLSPFDEGGDWNDKGITGISRFLNKVWRIVHKPITDTILSADEERILHHTIKQVTSDISNKKFNTAISRLMEFVNHFNNYDAITNDVKLTLVKLIAPIAPHMSEELWELFGNDGYLFDQVWPKYDLQKLVEETITIAIQVNGKRRDEITVPKNIDKSSLLTKVKQLEKIQSHIDGKEIIKEIVVPGRLVSLVIR